MFLGFDDVPFLLVERRPVEPVFCLVTAITKSNIHLLPGNAGDIERILPMFQEPHHFVARFSSHEALPTAVLIVLIAVLVEDGDQVGLVFSRAFLCFIEPSSFLRLICQMILALTLHFGRWVMIHCHG